jgi:RTX calcium-binding nonapeptide repeat (4 copies)/LVIVD repeat
MRKGRRWLVVSVSLVALIALGMPPSTADHATRTDVRNLEPLGESPNTDTLANSDLAFWGDMAFQGHWEGWRVLDISNPGNPTELLDYTNCQDPTLGIGGGQGDIIVWENLLVRAWNSGASATGFCGGTPADMRDGFEGIHVFDISNVTNPQLVAAVDIDDGAAEKPPGITTGCGAHTLTAVPDPANGTLYVYVGGSSQLCPGMDLVEIPLSSPSDAEWFGRAEAIPTGAELGRSCHDITVYLVDKNRAVCSGSWTDTDPEPDLVQHGFAYFSMDAADGGSLDDPVLKYQVDVPGTSTIGHTSAFSWDGKILGWSHEPGGGVAAACEITDPIDNRRMFWFAAETGSMKGMWAIPTQSADESCASVHIMQSIPTLNGRDVFSSGTYMAGTYVLDYTDPTNPHAIGWSDPPADVVPAPPGLILGGAWATYWYNGFLYESNIKKGLFVHESTSPEAQTPVVLDFLNPQTMMPFETPAPVLCKGEEATHIGTPGPDSLVGTPGDDVIAGLGGADDIEAGGGRDLVCAGGGGDDVAGMAGPDRLFGQDGRDHLAGGPGQDRCNGGPGRDTAASCERRTSIP